MATETATTEHNHPVDTAGHDDAHHPSDRQYWKIFWILLVVTAVEVALYYFSLPGVHLNNAALGALAVLKFVIVVGFFMHLKFDSKILRRLFVTGLALAIVVYMVVLLSMGVFLENPDDRNSSTISSFAPTLLR
jgi:cytochrome c oxidase subunit IV